MEKRRERFVKAISRAGPFLAAVLIASLQTYGEVNGSYGKEMARETEASAQRRTAPPNTPHNPDF